MKTFLIATALLMTAASVYGVVDYTNKAGTKEFDQLYKEEPETVETEAIKEATPPPPFFENKKEIKTDVVTKAEAPPVKKTIKKKVIRKKKQEEILFRPSEFSRGKLG